MNPKRDPIRGRMIALMLFCSAVAGAVALRALKVQVIGDPRLEAMAHRQFQGKVLIRPPRGIILDRNGEPLAVNSETQSLAANPMKITQRRRVAQLLAKATDLPFAKIFEKLSEKREFVWIKRHLPENEMNRFRKLRLVDADGDFVAGLWVIKEAKRIYPHGELAAHVLGGVNLDSDGLEGVELWKDEKLRGKISSVEAVRDALGRPTFIDADAAQNLRDGETIQLTLDSSLQFSVERELKAAVNKANAHGGTAIVMDARTGEVLAMANEPSFNPNERSAARFSSNAASNASRRNRAVTDGYEPGSTLKAVLLSGAIAHGSKLTDSVFGEHGSFILQGKRISEAEAHEQFEWISLKKMIQVSSNVGAAKLALKLGPDHYLSTLKAFGFGNRTGIGFPGEISGRIPPRKSWQPLTLANIGFGQGILVTPLQMLRAYAVFANGGYLVQPTLIKQTTKPEPQTRILSQTTVDSVTEALKAVTEEGGTGVNARVEGYTVAGKTGTAQEVDRATGKYSKNHYVASFIGFPVATSGNKSDHDQRLVIFTSIHEPRGVYYAAETAAPLFAAVLGAAASRLSLPSNGGKSITSVLADQGIESGRDANRTPTAQPSAPHLNSALSDRLQYSLAKVVEAPAQSTYAASKESSQAGGVGVSSKVMSLEGTTANGTMLWRVPSLRGISPREALKALQGHRLRLEMKGVGLVRSQSPEPGGLIADGSTIKLGLSEQ